MNEESTIAENGGLLMNRRTLPIEMLETLFTFLPPGDLKTVMLVCKKWKEAASAPKLWTWVVFKLRNFDASTGLGNIPEALRLPRLRAVKKLEISDMVVKDKLLRIMMEHPGLKTLVMQGCDVRQITQKQVLAHFFTKMEELHLFDNLMNNRHRMAFFQELKERHAVKELSLCEPEHDSASYNEKKKGYADLPAAVKKVERLKLELNLTPLDILKELFQIFKDKDCSVKSFSFSPPPHNGAVPRPHLSFSFPHLEELTLEWGGWIGTEECQKICHDIEQGSNMKKLAIRRIHLSADASVFSGAAQHLVELDLGNTNLQPLEHLIFSISQNVGKLKKLNLQGNDLEDAQSLPLMATKIESLNISKTELSSRQAEDIFKAIAHSPGALKNLNIDSNDLREVDPQVMAEAVNKLEMVCLSDKPKLTQTQMREILKSALEKGTTLRELSVSPERRMSMSMIMSVFHEKQIKIMYNKLFPRVDLPK